MTSGSDNDSPSRKRQRVGAEALTDVSQYTQVDETQAPLGDAEITRDEKLWFDDGSIILIARDTAFRVHAGVLSRESTVFQNMIENMKEMKSERMYDCPVMRISDTAMDLRFLLSVLYDGAR